jgi:cytochrome P450
MTGGTCVSSDDALYWDPYDSRFAADPWPLFRRIREEAPLYYDEAHDFYALSQFADVERALTDTDTFSSPRGVILELIKMNMEMPPGTLIGAWLGAATSPGRLS